MVRKRVENIKEIRSYLKSAHQTQTFGNAYFYWVGGGIK